jgi:2,4-dienoyl-CoA reductase-like NADH-dependent reductase (Old Yellow Enzyme family)
MGKDFEKVRKNSSAATLRALVTGFEILEIRLAHGYLLISFLSPMRDRREDKYGGSLDNHIRFR